MMTEITVNDQPTQAVTPARLLEIAVSQDADIDKLSQLMDLQQRYEEAQARKSFKNLNRTCPRS